MGMRPWLEGLENRIVLSMITWNTTTHPDGGDWDNPADWNGGAVPGPSDTAEITGLTSPGTVFLDSNLADSISSLITDSSATLEVTNGSLTLGAASSSTLGGPFIVVPGASVSVEAGANIQIAPGQTLTDNGALSFAAGDSVTLQSNCCGSGQIAVGGTLTANDITFAGSSGDITVNSGGHLIATNSTFSVSQLTFNNSSVLNSGDLTGNAFNTTIFVPYNDVQYLGDNASFQQININAGTLASGTLDLNLIGTSTSNLTYVFPGGFTVASEATLAVGPNVPLVIPPSQTLTDNGAVSFGAGDSVTLQSNCCGSAAIAVSGTLTADDMTFPGGNGSITVNSGGHLIATNSTFSISQLTFNNTSVLNSGDLTGDTFNTTMFVPYNDVQYLGNNISFQQININAGILASGTFNLNLIGTITSNLTYVFPGGFTVDSGATLAVGSNVPLFLPPSQTLTDNGAVSFGAGDSVTLQSNCCGSAAIAVSGTLTADDMTFPGGNGSITVNSGGHLIATNSTFSISQLTFNNTSVLNSGDLTGDTFNTTMFVPYNDVQYLGNNISFQQININAGILASGTFNLNLIGTITSNLTYVFPGGFTVDSGATLAVGSNVPLFLPPSQTLTDNGAVSFGAGDSVTLQGNCCGSAAIAVSGTLTADDMTFPGGNGSITVNSGGHLIATNSTFSISQLTFNNTSVLNSGDLTGDTFNTTMFVPYNDVQYLGNNISFQQININAGILASGTFNLNLIGTITSNLTYVFPGGFTVDSGATLAVGSNVPLFLPPSQTLTDNGAVSFGAGDSVTLQGNCCGSGAIAVNGTLTADDMTFPGGNGSITVSSGGTVAITNSTLNLSSVNLNSGSTASMNTVVFSGVLNINSGAIVGTPTNPTITGNDFSNVGANGIVASGDPNAQIPFSGNYWGTTVTAQIAAKIDDHNDNANLPTIAYQPFVSSTSGTSASPVTATFSPDDQTLTLSATVTSSAGGAINVGTETFTILNGTQTIGSPTAPVPVSNSMATAMFTLPAGTLPGNYIIEAHYSGSGSDLLPATDTSHFLTVSPGPASQLKIQTEPSGTATAGQVFQVQPVIYEEDQYGNLETGDNSTMVTASVPSGFGPLLGSTTATVVGGIARFTNLFFDDSPENIMLSFSSGTLVAATSSNIDVSSAAAAKVVFGQEPSNTSTGDPISPAVTVKVEDAFGNVVTSDNSSVTLTLSTGVFEGNSNAATMTAVNGVATFSSLKIDVMGDYTLTATDGILTASGPSANFSVTKPMATKVVITQQPSNAVAGSPISPSVVVTVEDDQGDIITDNSSTVTLTLSSQSFEGGLTTATAVASGGVATFNGLKIDVAGNYTLIATDVGLAASGPSVGFTISPAPVTRIAATTSFASSDVAGTTGTVTVTAYDTYNNIVGSGPNEYLGKVNLSSTDGRLSGLPASYTFVVGDRGSHTFTNIAFKTVGSQTIKATDSAKTALASITTAVTVTPAVASQLVIIIPPYPTVTAGTPLTDPIVLDEEDAYGNLVTSDNTTKVTASLASGAGNLLGTTQVSIAGGVASFGDLQDNTAGSLSLQFAAPSLPPVTSPPSIVTPAPASTLVIKRPPTGVISGGYLPPIEVDAQDPYGNLATSFNGVVTLTDGVGQLSGTATMAAVAGVAAFPSLVATGSGAISLSATAGALTTGAGGGITIEVNPAPPAINPPLLVYSTQKEKNGKKVGKPIFAGYTIDYSTAMDPLSVGNHSHYNVDIFTVKKGKKKTKVLKPIGFSLINVTSKSVTIKVSGTQTFPNGGQITVIGGTDGVESSAEVPLATSEVFDIFNGGKHSTGPTP